MFFIFLTLEHSDQVLNNIENVVYTTEVNYFFYFILMPLQLTELFVQCSNHL